MGLQFNLGDAETLNALDDSVGGGVHNLNENELLSMIQQDQFELEKLMLKRDHEILSACIVEEPDGSIKILKSPKTLLFRGGPKSSSSSSSLDSMDEKQGIRPSQIPADKKTKSGTTNNAFQIQPHATAFEDNKYFSPMKQSSAQAAARSKETSAAMKQGSERDLRKLKFAEKQHSQSFKSNQSSSVHENDSDLLHS